MNTQPNNKTGEGNAPRMTRSGRTMTDEQYQRMRSERYYCDKCDRSHHIFNFGPRSTRKIAVCGTAFPILKGE